jgi:Ca2+-binding RTX toxin-like protein
VSGLSFTGAHFAYTVHNGGAGNAAASTAGVYISTTPTGPETLIGTIATGALTAGASETDNGVITWASNTAPGTYYVSVAADSQKTVAESNETNNESSKIALLLGNNSANKLAGTSGNDVIIGLGGADTLTGNAGADQFVFNTALKKGMAVATIADFSHSQGDVIDLDHTIFTALTNVGVGAALASADFYASSKGVAHLATDHILYNTSTGALSYDPDGTGSAAAIQFAVVTGHPALTAHDFMVV